MKKLLAVLLAVMLVLSFAACSGSNDNNEEAKTPAQMVYADFKAKLEAGEKDVLALAQAVIENEETIPFMGGAIEVEEGYLNGFTSEIAGFSKGAMFAPMIGTIPFVGYIFELAEDADVDAFKAALKENADLRWNICTQADEMVCENEGNIVFFVMAPATFEDDTDTEGGEIELPDEILPEDGAEIPDDADLGISIG